MKLFLKGLKIFLSSILFLYVVMAVFFLFFSNKEKRFHAASHAQGTKLSQTLFKILKFQNPENSDIYFEQSVAYNKYGYYNKGFELLDQAVDLNPKMHLGYRGYMKLRFLRDFDGALADFDRLDSLTPNFNDAPWGENIDFLRGECHYGNKDYAKAIDAFQLNIDNQESGWADVHSFVYLGMCEYELGNFEKSIIDLNNAIKESDKTPEAYFYLAKVYKAMDSLPKARQNLIKAKELISYKRTDPYNEYLNEIYLNEVMALEKEYAE